MPEQEIVQPELPNLVSILESMLKGTPFAHFLSLFENVIFSLILMVFFLILTYFATRRKSLIPQGLQNIFEIIVSGFDDFVCGILGSKGRKLVPFIGTLFVYILSMNLIGFIPFFKSSTSSWSTTLALALCVFVYVQYTAFKELGVIGYIDHLSGNTRGFLLYTIFIPVLMFCIHVITELIKPFSLSMRLRSNIWGDDLLLAFLAGFGLKGIPLLLFNTFLALIAAVVQAGVFCLLTTIYFALVMPEEE